LVRCARCGSSWLPAPDAGDAIPQKDLPEHPPPDAERETTPPTPDVTAMDRLAAAHTSPPVRTHLIGAWVLTFVVLAAAVAAAVGWRDALIQAWPPSGRILATTGHAPSEPAQTAGKKAE
jgi:hypothetical protein